jgi:U3 small nucleolar ribonucleoprotein component
VERSFDQVDVEPLASIRIFDRTFHDRAKNLQIFVERHHANELMALCLSQSSRQLATNESKLFRPSQNPPVALDRRFD